MFTYTVEKSFNIKEKYNVVPFGYRCTSALVCKYSGLRKISLPFDWTIPAYPDRIQKVLENDFADFIPSNIRNGVFKNKYEIGLAHFDKNIDEGINMYKRRIDRFKYILNNDKHIYFIFVNEDYLYNPDYRNNDFNNSILENMYKLENYIKKNYKNLTFNILYFDFTERKIECNSNVIYFQIASSKLYNHDCDVVGKFRRFISEILAAHFKTNVNCSISELDYQL